MSSNGNDQSLWLTRGEMEQLCPSCAAQMREKKITKLKVMNEAGEIVLEKAGFSQGLCDKFGGASGFRTRCMDSSISDQVDDTGAFCNKLKIFCHGSAGAEGKRARIIEKDAKQRYTLGVVYEPDELDTDGEFAKAEDIERAAWDFMRYLQGRGDAAKAAIEVLSEISEAAKRETEVDLEITDALDEVLKRGVNGMHIEDLEHAEIVESWIAPVDMKINGEVIKQGSWLAGIVWDEDSFKKVESGEWTGYSMGGWAKKVNAD